MQRNESQSIILRRSRLCLRQHWIGQSDRRGNLERQKEVYFIGDNTMRLPLLANRPRDIFDLQTGKQVRRERSRSWRNPHFCFRRQIL